MRSILFPTNMTGFLQSSGQLSLTNGSQYVAILSSVSCLSTENTIHITWAFSISSATCSIDCSATAIKRILLF